MSTTVYESGQSVRVSVTGNQGPAGPAGPTGVAGPSNNTRETLSALKASNPTDVSSLYDGSLWFWTTGNFTGKTDDSTVVKADSTAITIGAWVRQTVRLTPEMYGAVGGLGVDDSLAFEKLSSTLTALGGGAVVLRSGATYNVGRQIANSGGRRWSAPDVISAVGLKYFLLDMNGAELKMNPGLFFGAFDAANNPTTTTPNFNVAQQANQPVFIRAQNCGFVDIRNGRLNGNGSAGVVGGPYADTGRQCVSYGIYAYGNKSLVVENCHAFDWLLDGFAAGSAGQNDSTVGTPFTFRNCTSFRSGRNCFSLIGGNQPLFENCVFWDAGNCANSFAGGPGYVSSSPASAFDIEAEATEVRNPIFIGCQFLAGPNANTCMVSDSGTSRGHHFLNCRFDGNIFVSKPDVVIERSRIDGKFGKLNSDTQIIDCFGSDTPIFSPAQSGLFMDAGGSGAGVLVRNCQFTLARCRLNIRGYRFEGRSVISLAFGTTTAANRDYAVLADNVTGSGLTFVDLIGTALGDPPVANEGYFIQMTGSAVKDFSIVASSNYFLKWNSWSNGGGGYPRIGRTDASFDTAITTVPSLRVQINPSFGGGENRWGLWEARSTAPAIGSYLGGSMIINSAAALGGNAGWVVAGGAFQPFGIIGAVRAVGLTSSSTAADIVAALKTAGLAS